MTKIYLFIDPDITQTRFIHNPETEMQMEYEHMKTNKRWMSWVLKEAAILATKDDSSE